MRCRPACARDAARLADIYAPYVADTAITFATAMPTEGEFAEKIARIGAAFPFLVYEEEGRVLGYAYAATYRVREAYRWDVELSIYVDTSCRGRGVGKTLMERLLRCLRAQGYQNAYSCITLPNERSIGLHTRFGFTQIGLFQQAGYKLGKWHDVVWLRLPLGDFPESPAEPTPFSALAPEKLAALMA